MIILFDFSVSIGLSISDNLRNLFFVEYILFDILEILTTSFVSSSSSSGNSVPPRLFPHRLLALLYLLAMTSSTPYGTSNSSRFPSSRYSCSLCACFSLDGVHNNTKQFSFTWSIVSTSAGFAHTGIIANSVGLFSEITFSNSLIKSCQFRLH